MERREQVFVSSTYLDLIEERQAVIQTLLEADCIPSGMELFPASNDERWDLIKRVIEGCDYYLVVLGGRYGSVDDDGVSFTEKEFDYAQEIGLPTMGFVHADIGELPLKKADLDPGKQEALAKFREKVEKRIVKRWTTPDDLGAQVAKSLIQLRKTNPAEGWVRARDAMTPEARAEMAELRERIADLEREQAVAASAVPDDVSDLAQGADSVALSYDVRSRYGTDQYRDAIVTTWDDVFRVAGAALLDEGTERQLAAAVNSHIEQLVDDGHAPESGEGHDAGNKVALTDTSLADLRVQYFALGLIEPGTKKRGVNDKGSYWKLTRRGAEHLMRLRAVRRT